MVNQVKHNLLQCKGNISTRIVTNYESLFTALYGLGWLKLGCPRRVIWTRVWHRMAEDKLYLDYRSYSLGWSEWKIISMIHFRLHKVNVKSRCVLMSLLICKAARAMNFINQRIVTDTARESNPAIPRPNWTPCRFLNNSTGCRCLITVRGVRGSMSGRSSSDSRSNRGGFSTETKHDGGFTGMIFGSIVHLRAGNSIRMNTELCQS